jgi:protein-tyrosine-phosphatase
VSRDLPGAVLFACSLNSVRSPMAEAMMKQLYGFEIYVDSCGVEPKPDLDPFAVAVIDELGADLSHHHPKSFDDLRDGSFDLVISLTPEAHHRAGEFARGKAMETLYWPTHDPTDAAGSREAVLDAYRATRDHLRARIIERFGPPLSVGG